MTALTSGENRPWDDVRVTAYVTGARVSALLLDEGGRALGPTPWVRDVAVRGVEHLPGATEGVTALLDAVDPAVERILVVATDLAGAPSAQLLRADGTVAFTIAGRVGVERALVMAEIYRRQGVWKVRAIAQGYAGGMEELARVYGAAAPVTVAAGEAAPPPPAPAGPAPTSVQDPVRRIGMILDDASRSTASYLSSAEFAERRLEQELERIVGDPAMRVGPAGDAARAAASRQRDDLVSQARERHAADLTQLTVELDGLADSLPAALAPWQAAGWSGRAVVGEPAFAIRVGELSHESAPLFRLPMVRTLPLGPPLWIETDDGGTHPVGQMVAALASRILVALPRPPQIAVIDVGGRVPLPPLPLTSPVATDTYAAGDLLREHADHLGLVEAALQSRSVDSLPPQHRPGRLLIVTDFPGGLDDSSVAQLHRIAVQGPSLGVNLVLAGRRPQSLGIPILDVIHDQCLRIPTGSGGDLVDAFGGVTWVFHPDLGPADPAVQQRVQNTITEQTLLRDEF